MSRSWLLYLDDLIASAERIGRLTAGRTIGQFVADEAAYGAVFFATFSLSQTLISD